MGVNKLKQKIPVPKDSDVGDAVETTDFKDSLVSTLQESNTARNEMKAVIHEILRQPDTIDAIKAIVIEVDRDAIKVWWSRFGHTVWSGFIFVLGIAVTIAVQRLLI